MEITPAPADSGITIVRTDIDVHNEIKPLWNTVVDTMMCTRVANEHAVSVGTIEHVVAALYACNIDNAVIRVDGAEIPVMDGSSEVFVEKVRTSELVTLEAPRKYLKICKQIKVEHKGATAEIAPHDTLLLDFHFDFRGRADFPAFKRSFEVGKDSFDEQLANARTFGILEEVNQLWEAGLARGGSLENAVVVSGNKVLNSEGLRHDDEFVRHKLLDALGDLYLAGYPIIGHFKGHNSGHGLNNQLLHAIFADESSYEIVELNNRSAA